MNDAQVETPNTGNETLPNFNFNVQEGLGDKNSENQQTEPSQISNEIQVWTQIFEQKKNDRIMKIREEMGHKFKTILKKLEPTKLHQQLHVLGYVGVGFCCFI